MTRSTKWPRARHTGFPYQGVGASHLQGSDPSLCAPSALRRSVCGATMTTPGGAGTTSRTVFGNSFVLGSSAALIGSELSSLLGSDSSLCPLPRRSPGYANDALSEFLEGRIMLLMRVF